jgi:hypothetical protein
LSEWWDKLPSEEGGWAAIEMLGAGTSGRKAVAKHINTIVMLFVALFFGAASIGSVHAQDCPRGDLDAAYCDRDGDLVADAPTDPKQLVNPSTLIFAYTPVEDPAVYCSTGRSKRSMRVR